MILQVLCHLYAIQATTLQALQISQTTSYPWMTMEFHFYGLYQENPIILQIWHYPDHSQLAYQADNLYSCLQHYHVYRLSMSVHSSCVPSYVIFNRGLEFVLNFFYFLGTTLDMQLHFTLDYYPEGDEQSKYTNLTLKQYLYIYCNY